MSKLPRAKESSNSPYMKFDIRTLNTLITYAVDPALTKTSLNNLQMVFESINLDSYLYNQDIYDRVLLLKYIIQLKVEDEITDLQLLLSCIISKDEELESLIDSLDWEYKLDPNSSKIVSRTIAERAQYILVFKTAPKITDLLTSMYDPKFSSFHDMMKTLRRELSQLLMVLQSTDLDNGRLVRFNFSEADLFNSVIETVYEREKKPTNILQTGIRQLNALLLPGFFSGKLYVFMGLSGKFKSGLLLNIAIQLRLFNPQIKPVEDGVRKIILFVSLENFIEETIVRMFDMFSEPYQEMKNLTLDEVKKILLTKGKFFFNSDEGIDIEFRYYPPRSKRPSDIYSIITELQDNGYKVIAVILDYLYEIESDKPNNGDERMRLTYATNELKYNIAGVFDIPVITVVQANRTANAILEAALRENKQDVLKYMDSSHIGNCWNIYQIADWFALIYLERQVSTGKLFLAVNRAKIRYKNDSTVSVFFNHPFTNEKEILLETDVDKDATVSILSLGEDGMHVDIDDVDYHSNSRPVLNSDYKKNMSGLNLNILNNTR